MKNSNINKLRKTVEQRWLGARVSVKESKECRHLYEIMVREYDTAIEKLDGLQNGALAWEGFRAWVNKQISTCGNRGKEGFSFFPPFETNQTRHTAYILLLNFMNEIEREQRHEKLATMSPNFFKTLEEIGGDEIAICNWLDQKQLTGVHI